MFEFLDGEAASDKRGLELLRSDRWI